MATSRTSASTRASNSGSGATPRSNSRAIGRARTDILTELKEDHKRVKKAYREFQKLDVDSDPEAVGAIVAQVLDELTVHAAIEEELLYPAARQALKDEDLLNEAEVEHESVHTFVDQLRGMNPGDEKYRARFTVLCEYVMHHVKEEETEMFPQLERARGIDWETLAMQMGQRRAELTGADEAGDDGELAMATDDAATAAPARGRSTAVTSRRRSGG